MAGLLDLDRRTSLGLLMAGAQMMNTPRQDGAFGAIGNGLLGFAQGLLDQEKLDRERAREDKKDARQSKLDDVEMELKRAQAEHYLMSGSKEADPYFTPIPTANGVYGFDNRSGKVMLAIDENGKPVIKSSDSPELQGNIAASRKRGETANSLVEIDNQDGSKSKMLGGTAFPNLLQPNFQSQQTQGNYVPPRQTDLSTLPQINGNNYGNIRPIGATKGFQNFETPEAGLTAIDQNLAAYGSKHGINTLGGVISRWSPPNENNTNQLIANAAKVTGLDPNQPIDLSNKNVRAVIGSAILKQENGIDITPDDFVNLQNPLTKPTVGGMILAAKSGVEPTTVTKEGVNIAKENLKNAENIDKEAQIMYKGQTQKEKLDNETAAAVEKQKQLDALKIQTEPKITAAKKEAEIKAESQANAELGLPQAQADAQSTLDVINKLKNHSGLEKATGLSGMFFNKVAGTDAYDFANLHNQATGKVFMQAFQSLKGAGAITDAEGKAATQAISRMGDLRQSKESYLQALSELESVVKNGLNRKQSQAGASSPATPTTPAKLSGDDLVNFYLNGGK